MSYVETLSQRWSNYRPSKTQWFWSVAGAAILVVVLGFTIGGWTTESGATLRAKQAVHAARAELAASVCVDRFTAAEDAVENLALLKKTAYWERDEFIEKGGWAKLAGKDVPGSTDLCADQLTAMENLPNATAEVVPASSGG